MSNIGGMAYGMGMVISCRADIINTQFDSGNNSVIIESDVCHDFLEKLCCSHQLRSV